MKQAPVVGLIAALVLTIAVATPFLLAGKGDPEAGKGVYTKRCAACHGPTGEAREAIAKSLKVEMRHLADKAIQEKSDDDLRKAIVEGTDKKKPVKGLSDDDLANVIAYLRTLKK
jgi:mono/diheme cytochrome c family protein